MEAAKRLRAKVQALQITTGVLATDLLWPQLVEFLQRAEIDYLIADQEHGVHSDTQVARVCALGRQGGFPVLIRPIDTETSTIRRAIDRGPCGLLLPTVESATQLDRVRDGIWMPPRGKRVPGGQATTGWGISGTRRGRPAWRMTSSFYRRSNRGRDWSASTNETQNKTGEAIAPVAHSRSRVTVVVEMPKTTPQGKTQATPASIHGAIGPKAVHVPRSTAVRRMSRV